MKLNAEIFGTALQNNDAEKDTLSRKMELLETVLMWNNINEIDTSISLDELLNTVEEAPILIEGYRTLQERVQRVAVNLHETRGIRKRRIL